MGIIQCVEGPERKTGEGRVDSLPELGPPPHLLLPFHVGAPHAFGLGLGFTLSVPLVLGLQTWTESHPWLS